jgi:hypothetical protein
MLASEAGKPTSALVNDECGRRKALYLHGKKSSDGVQGNRSVHASLREARFARRRPLLAPMTPISILCMRTVSSATRRRSGLPNQKGSTAHAIIFPRLRRAMS